MQEEVENRTLKLVITKSKLSVRTLIDGLRYAVRKADHKIEVIKDTKARAKAKDKMDGPHGKQTVKQLIGHGETVRQLPVGTETFKPFERILRKHGVDFAIMKTKEDGKPRYLAFFRAKDEAVITSVLADCAEKRLYGDQEKKQSVIQKLEACKEKVASRKRKVRQKEKELTR